MAVLHAGGFHYGVLVNLSRDRLVDDQVPQHLDQLLRSDSAGAQQPGPVLGQVHNGGLHPHPAGASVHNGIDFAVVVVAHVLRRGGRGLAGDIGRGSRNGHPRQGNDLPGNVTVRAADGNGIQPGGGALGHNFLHGQHHGQRAGPKFLGQTIGAFGNIVAEPLHFLGLGHVEDQGIVLRATLGLKNFQNGVFVQSVGTQAIDRLRGDCHKTAVSNNGGSNFRRFLGIRR